MAGLKYVTMTQLFWDSLEKHRNNTRYPEIRAKIAWCVQRKSEDRNFMTNGDAPFVASANKHIAGIWHCKLSTNPDVVMFYTISGDTMNLAMIGSHHDYPFQGKNTAKAETLGGKIHRAVALGHIASPGWQKLRWNTPSDLVGSPDLNEMSLDQLVAIQDVLKMELEDAPLFKETFGYALDDADMDTFTQWLVDTDAALEAVDNAQRRARKMLRETSLETTNIAEFSAGPKMG